MVSVAQSTPVVDPSPPPTPAPDPLYLTLVSKAYDPLIPGPLVSTAQGYVAKLNPAGREACRPATHILLDKPEGTASASPLALLYRSRPDPMLNLDLYLGDYVEVSGLGSLTPEACRSLTWQQIAVRGIEQREVPPGNHWSERRPPRTHGGE